LTQKTQTSGTSTIVQTLSIDSKNSGLTPSMNLPAGNYSIKVSGKYVYRVAGGVTSEADAAHSFRPVGIPGGNGGWVSGDSLPSPFTGALTVRANGQNLDYGAPNAGHVYTSNVFTTTTEAPINFSIYDNFYTDNSGSLTIEITKIAETNGCTTFLNLDSTQNYTVTETMKPNWSFVKATSNSEMLVNSNNSVNQTLRTNGETLLTFTNRFTAPITSGGGNGGQLYFGGNGGPIINSGNISTPASTTQSKPTAVKGVDDNESAKKSQSSQGNTTNSQNSQNTKLSNTNGNVEYRIRLVPEDKKTVGTKIISNSGLIRTGGNENVQLAIGSVMIMMGAGLYLSFKTKKTKESPLEQL